MADVAHPTCAAALADAVVDRPVTFQINRWCRLRDRTGGVDVDMVSTAIPALYGCSGEEELRAQLGAQSLTSTKNRLKDCGLLRVEQGVTRRFVTMVEPTDLQAKVSMTAMRLSRGLSNVAGDGVLAVPARGIPISRK